MTLGRRRSVRVPASSANLGPGFDVLAAALALHLDLEVVENGTFAVETELDVPTDRTNLVVRAFERLHPSDGFTFRIASRIPPSGGLGSSAAAIVAGLMAADHMFELDADISALATELEGHPDNVAAALHDRLHQPYRAHLYPRSAELVERAPALGALGATISGAGPTVLVWSHFEQTGGLVEQLGRECRGWAKVMRVPFESQGADVRGM